jgi:bidirectional [NiFe] hydrogenase diaphorase subunit
LRNGDDLKILDLVIDGKNAKAREGTTILDAAEQVGIHIPRLCYHEGTEHLGGCRICSVEVERNGRKNIVTACSYPIEDGLKVTTRSQKIDKIRKTILELAAVGSGPNVAGDFNSLAWDYKADLTRFNSIVHTDQSNCILCGLCVSRCKEATFDGVIGFVGRGVNKKIAIFPEKSQTCMVCNYCYPVCPTGRISPGTVNPPFPTVNELLSGRK